MAHKTRVSGTNYEVSGGKTLVGGTAYQIDKGRTLISGTGYDISFSEPITVTVKNNNYVMTQDDYNKIDISVGGVTFAGFDTGTTTVPAGSEMILGSSGTSFYVVLNGSQVGDAYGGYTGKTYSHICETNVTAARDYNAGSGVRIVRITTS